METNNTRPFTKWFRNQPPRRKFGTIPGTDASIRRDTIYTNWVWSVATGRGSPTKRVTTTVGKPQLMDQMRAGVPHQEAAHQTKTKTKEGRKTSRIKKFTSEGCIPTSFLFCYNKVPIEPFFAHLHSEPQYQNLFFHSFRIPSATISMMFFFQQTSTCPPAFFALFLSRHDAQLLPRAGQRKRKDAKWRLW